MAVCPFIFQPHTRYTSPLNFIPHPIMFRFSPSKSSSTFSTKRRVNRFNNSNFTSHVLTKQQGKDVLIEDVKVLDHVKRWIFFIRLVWPGGSRWKLHETKEENTVLTTVQPLTVLEALRRMWQLVADDSWVIYTAFASLTIAAISGVSIPNLLATSFFAAQSGEITVFHRNSLLLALLCLISGICSGLRSGCFGIANTLLVKRLRETLYGALIFQDISFFDKETVGDLTSRLGADCQRLSHVIDHDIHLILRNVLQGTGALVNLMTLSWPLAVSTLVICSLLSVIFLIYGQYRKKAAKITQDFTACSNEVLEETLSMVRTLRIYGTEREELGRYKQWLEKIAFISVRESVAYGFWTMSFDILHRLTQVFAIMLGGLAILSGHASAEQLTKYVLYCEWLIYAAWRIEDNLSSLFQSIGATEKVFQLMNLLPSDQYLSKGVKPQRLTWQIEFVNVSFDYPLRIGVPVLQNVNFSVLPNEVVAIVGLSGSGKSTLVNLLLRLYEPTHGDILIDGIPLRELDVRWLRENIGYVGQEPHLFRTDIKSNISYGMLREIKQEEIEHAAKQAYAHEFISSLPNGYDTIIDDNLLSGGQKQRIAIARSILRGPAILILDEPTSALDAESEYYIKKGILQGFVDNTKAKRTVIVIAHRLSTIKAADKIVVMDGGRIVEMGDHMELLSKNGLYARLNRIQADSFS